MLTNVLIDARWIRVGQRGIGNFTSNLIAGLGRSDNNGNIRFTIASNYSTIKEFKNIYFNTFDYIALPDLPDPIYDFIYFSWINIFRNFDIIHFTGNSGLLLFKRNTRVVLTLHDVSFLKSKVIVPQPQRIKQKIGRVYRRLFVKFFVKNSDEIVTVSKFAMNDIISEYPFIRKINYIYHGFNISQTQSIENCITIDYEVFKNKFLVISGNDPQKNLISVINAFSLIFESDYSEIENVVIVGLTLSEFVMQNPNTLITPNILFYGYLDNKELYKAIFNAKSIIIPSYYESFGLPVIEALFLRKILLCSNTGALTEIAKFGAIYFDPFNLMSLIRAIKSVNLFDLNIVDRWILENSDKFSWDRVSAFYINSYTDQPND